MDLTIFLVYLLFGFGVAQARERAHLRPRSWRNLLAFVFTVYFWPVIIGQAVGKVVFREEVL